MATHLVVGLSGVGKSTVLRCLHESHPECDVISFSKFSCEFITKVTGENASRQELSTIFTRKPELRMLSTTALNQHVMTINALGKRLIIESGGSLVNLEAGSMVSRYSIFSGVRFTSICAVFCEPSEHLARIKNDAEWHQGLCIVDLKRKAEDLRSFANLTALKNDCSLVLAWNDDVECCARTLFEGMCRAETADLYAHTSGG